MTRGLTTLDVKIIERIDQQLFVGSEILYRFDLVAADEPHQKSLIAGFVAVDDGFASVDDTLQSANAASQRYRQRDHS